MAVKHLCVKNLLQWSSVSGLLHWQVVGCFVGFLDVDGAYETPRIASFL